MTTRSIWLSLPLLLCFTQACRSASSPPNVVIIFTDDQGYGDLACYGHPTIATPHLDRLAAGGMKFTQFYVPSPVCSPSRAALLTGCYPKRVGMHGHVIFPDYDYGLHPDEVTVAEVLRDQQYTTGMAGKWHLGHRPGLMPLDQGFDQFLGVPYSNDMAQFHRQPGNKYQYRFPLMEGNEVVEWEPDQAYLTRKFTEAAVRFIDENQDRPFFYFLSHPMPHIPLYASEDFEGRSHRGLYGDVIEEIDWSVGQVVSCLQRNGIEENTLLVFTTDNGPWLEFKGKGGSAGPLRGGKGTNWEGGQRVPFIASWPGVVPAGTVCREVVTSMDLLPTIATLCDARRSDRKIDGRDVSGLLRGEGVRWTAPREFVYYTKNGELHGIRRGKWKLHLESGELYNVEFDIGEERDVAGRHEDLVQELRRRASELDEAITAEARPTLTVEELLFDPTVPVED